ncbi:meiosis inhibitor protein 1-like isoform X2 [Dysidea avara]|uniref:meiosis inhibitor protein 1-like isoform X2 n=1 Tax=Dysidea avara TaxID=196820 RepID=UPI00332CE70D
MFYLVVSAHNYSCSLDHVMLIGKLLHMSSELSQELITHHENFVEQLIGGLSYPDEMIKSECAYVLTQLCTENKPLPLPTVKKLCNTIMSMSAVTKSHNSTVNVLGLIKRLLNNSTHAQFLIQADHHAGDKKGFNLALLLKRVLLSTDESLQIAAVQCVKNVLDQFPTFCKDLLLADIAEFLFEGLVNRNEFYLRSVYEVLDLMAGSDEFYTSYHSIYGIEALLSSVESITRWQQSDLVLIGYNLIIKILARQPVSIPLITSASLLSQLFSLIHHGLSRDVMTVNMSACSLLDSVLKPHHMTTPYSVQSLLQLLALCVKTLEPLVDEELNKMEVVGKLEVFFSQSLTVLYNTLCLFKEDQSNVVEVDKREEVFQFILCSFDEVCLPAYLLHHENLCSSTELHQQFFELSCCLLEQCASNSLAHKLGYCGMIQIGWKVKTKCYSNNNSQLLKSVDEFLTELCYSFALSYGSAQIKDVMSGSLPDMSASLEENMKYLSQRSCEVNSHTEKKQSTTICVIYWAFLHDDIIVSPLSLLSALSVYICTHPNTHLLPATTLQQVVFLFAFCHQLSFTHEPIPSYQTASQMLTRALLRTLKPELLFIPHPVLLHWVFQQPSLKPVSTRWMVQLLMMIENDKDNLCRLHSTWRDPANYFASLGDCIVTIISVLLDLLCSEKEEVTTVASKLLHGITEKIYLINKPLCHSVMDAIQKSLLTTQRLEPLSDKSTTALLRLLLCIHTMCEVDIDIKIIYQVTNIILRSTDSHLLLTNLNLLYIVLNSTTTFSLQVATFLSGNIKFLEKLSSLIPNSTTSREHDLVSGVTMLIVASLLSNSQTKQASNTSTIIHISLLQAALNSELILVQVSGLYLWQSLLKQNGRNTLFTFSGAGDHTAYYNIRILLFLLQNSLIKDNIVRDSAVNCFACLLHYAFDEQRGLDKRLHQQQWNDIIAEYIINLHYNEPVPTTFIKYLAIVMHYKFEPNSISPNRVAQFVYKKLIAISREQSLLEEVQYVYSVCLGEIIIRSSSYLTEEEWRHTGSILLPVAKKHLTDKCKFTKHVYTTINGVTVCSDQLWHVKEEHFENALKAYVMLLENL